MKITFAFVLVALLCATIATDAKPWGKFINISVNKNYNGPNFADILSNLVRQKMEFKNNIWNAFMTAKTQSYSHSYNAQPFFTKTITFNSNSNSNHGSGSGDCNKDVSVEVTTRPPIPQKVTAPLVEHEKTFEFNAQGSFSSGASASASSSSGATSAALTDAAATNTGYLPPKHSSGSGRSSSDDSDLVDITELQRDNE